MKVSSIKKVRIEETGNGKENYTVIKKYERVNNHSFIRTFECDCKDTKMCPICGDWDYDNGEHENCNPEISDEDMVQDLEIALNDEIGSRIKINNTYIN